MKHYFLINCNLFLLFLLQIVFRVVWVGTFFSQLYTEKTIHFRNISLIMILEQYKFRKVIGSLGGFFKKILNSVN